MRRSSIVVMLLVIALTGTAIAQAPTPAPNWLQIYREEVKPQKQSAHTKHEAGWPKAFKAHGSKVNYIALNTVTGPSESWYLSGYESVEAWAKESAAISGNAGLQAELDRLAVGDSEFLNAHRSILARYRADLSHRPGVSMPTQRYLQITIFRVKPGSGPMLEEYWKNIKAAHEKAGVKDNHSIFQVQSGMIGPAFIVLTPMKSLAEVDGWGEVHGKTYQDAMGDAMKRNAEIAMMAINNVETMIFAFSPSESIPSPAWIEADPGFWGPKPAAKPAAKKPAGD